MTINSLFCLQFLSACDASVTSQGRGIQPVQFETSTWNLWHVKTSSSCKVISLFLAWVDADYQSYALRKITEMSEVSYSRNPGQQVLQSHTCCPHKKSKSVVASVVYWSTALCSLIMTCNYLIHKLYEFSLQGETLWLLSSNNTTLLTFPKQTPLIDQTFCCFQVF